MPQQRLNQSCHIRRDDLRSFVRRVNPIRLNVAVGPVCAFQNEGQIGHLVLLRQCRIDRVEFRDVIGAITWRQRDACQSDLRMRCLQLVDHAGEVCFGLLQRKPAQAIVAAKLQHHHVRVQGDHASDAVEAVFGRVAADAFVHDTVRIVVTGQNFLEVLRIGLARIDPIAGCDTVAKAHDGRSICCLRWLWLRHGNLFANACRRLALVGTAAAEERHRHHAAQYS